MTISSGNVYERDLISHKKKKKRRKMDPENIIKEKIKSWQNKEELVKNLSNKILFIDTFSHNQPFTENQTERKAYRDPNQK